MLVISSVSQIFQQLELVDFPNEHSFRVFNRCIAVDARENCMLTSSGLSQTVYITALREIHTAISIWNKHADSDLKKARNTQVHRF
jgi:hypothetical protein